MFRRIQYYQYCTLAAMNIPGVSIIKGEIIDKIDLSDFSSHLFIKKFAERFEDNYIEMLNESPGLRRFKKVHSKLGMFLTQNAEELKIRKVEKIQSENVFGNRDTIQYWRKV